MLQPKRTKYRKLHRLRSQNKGVATRGSVISFGEIGLKAVTAGEITARQIEAARRTIARSVKRGGKVWVRIFPDKVLTAKSGEVPMGSGKGAPDKWVAQVLPGKILFEMSGVEEELMRKAMKLASYKLCVKSKVIGTEI
ncbi:50S ribosomal protein L16 [Candidatus Gracilibacteria bacterium]|nr:50S ribosomal protein L16 [Candidatus Gracilibacteria bacterium]